MAGVDRTWSKPLTALGSGGLDVATDDTPPATYFDGLASDLLMVGEAARLCQGRLTLTTAVPVTTADVLAAATIYFTPFRGDYVGLYDGSSAWQPYHFTELSLSIAALLADTNYDIFVYDNAGTLTLDATAWTNDTTRATALATQDGVYVKTGALGRRYIGTIRMTSVAGECEDSEKLRGVWNYYNRVHRSLKAVDTTNSWTYTTATWRAANASTTLGVGRVGVVIGVAEDAIEAGYRCLAANTNGGALATGVGIDATATNSAQVIGAQISNANDYSNVDSRYRGVLAAGYHYIQSLEISAAAGTTTWYGDNGLAYVQGGLLVEVMA